MRHVAENDAEGVGMSIQEQRTGNPSLVMPARFLMVTMGGRHLAFDADSIRGVLTLEEAGYGEDPTIQGMVYRSVDLASRLRLTGDQTSMTTRLILLAERNMCGSIRVAQMHGILELHPSQVLPLPAQFRGPERGWYRGMILFDQSVAVVLNTTWVLEALGGGTDENSEQGGIPRLLHDQDIAVSDSRVC
jgi:chemotaxis protein histidine kinase CheA